MKRHGPGWWGRAGGGVGVAEGSRARRGGGEERGGGAEERRRGGQQTPGRQCGARRRGAIERGRRSTCAAYHAYQSGPRACELLARCCVAPRAAVTPHYLITAV